MQVYDHSTMLNAAATALAKRDGSSFDRLRQINRDWMQTDDERYAMDATLQAMQEAAYLLEGEPSELDDGTEWDGVTK